MCSQNLGLNVFCPTERFLDIFKIFYLAKKIFIKDKKDFFYGLKLEMGPDPTRPELTFDSKKIRS